MPNAQAPALALLKTCTRCKRALPLNEFYRRSPDDSGPVSRCKACCIDQNRKNYAKNGRDSQLRRTYGINQEQYLALLAGQGNACAICREQPESLEEAPRFFHVDHDHNTGQVRGVLCHRCNKGLGHFRDRVQLLLSATAYLLGGEQS